jgi:hypothetical protein
MNFLFSLSFNPLSLMKSTRLFRNFVFLFSLLGVGSFAWGERYETVFVYTEDTATMNHNDAAVYLQSNSCISTNSLQIAQGEVAYVFSSGANTKPNASTELQRLVWRSVVPSILVDINGLESNQTIKKNWSPDSHSWASSNAVEPLNIDQNAGPIVGPASLKIVIKPWSARSYTGYGSDNQELNRWSYSSYGNWDFKASEGFVTFRIVGAEQVPSKKFATVIPENASGNVRIVLEQSTDLINWSSANPGVFSPSTSKRFFRVRSVEE